MLWDMRLGRSGKLVVKVISQNTVVVTRPKTSAHLCGVGYYQIM